MEPISSCLRQVMYVSVFLTSGSWGAIAQTTYFQQDFSDPSIIFQSDHPDIGQVDILYARPNTASGFQINQGYIRFSRSGPGDEENETGGSVHMMRKTPLSPVPRSLYYQVRLEVLNSTLQARPAAYFYVGENLEYLPNPKILQPDHAVFSKFAIYLNADHSFQLRDTKVPSTSPPLSGPVYLTWVLNNEEDGFTYHSPAYTTAYLGAGKYDIWINDMLWIDEAGRISDVSLTNFSFAYYNGAADIHLTDFLIRDVAGILPLKLKLFEARDRATDVLLEWEMEPAYRAASFVIEKGTGPESFAPIGFLPAQMVPEIVRYHFVDTEPYPGPNFYRLKITGPDGMVSYSPVKKVQTAAAENASLILSPNPATPHVIRARLQGAPPEKIGLYSMTGHHTSATHVIGPSGELLIYPATLLSAGVYLLKAQWDGLLKSVKVLIHDP